MQNINILYKSYFFRAACFIFWLVICPRVSGQTDQKQIPTTEDYKLWSFLIPDKISTMANWASYRLRYDYSETDTLFVQRTADFKRIAFPGARDGKFNGELDFACISQDTFRLLNLKTQNLFQRKGALDFKFSRNQKFIVILYKSLNEKLSIEVIDRTGFTLFKTAGITNYCFDPERNGIVYSTQENNTYGIDLLLFKDSVIKKKITENYNSPYQNLIWKTESLAFIENDESAPSIYNFDIKKDKLIRLDSKTSGFPSEMKISNSSYNIPLPSIDGSLLFFWLKEAQTEALQDNSANVQIWNSKDKLLTDFKKFSPYHIWSDKLAVWNINENTVMQITNKELPKGFLNADYKHAFIYDPAAYEPQTRQNCPYDLYAVDLNNGKKELVVERYSYDEKPQGSPNGKYLCYAKNKQWWSYDVQNKKHTCLTQTIADTFFSEDSDKPGDSPPYGIAGWSKNDEVILYDRYDIWIFSSDGKIAKRLTKGREIQKTYRIKMFDTKTYYDDVHSGKNLIDLADGFLVTESNKETFENGLGWWNKKHGVKEYVWKKRKINQVSKAEKRQTYMYVEQNFENAPRLMIFDGKEKEIFRSNKLQDKYLWGKNERIDYEVSGIKSKGILYYPAGFIKGKKYPLILYVYEDQFSYFNEYINPSLLTGDGFNITNFTNQGYFVLLPNIVYELGNLRESVTNSVVAAADSAVAKGNIAKDKIGLIGHSFGGYETNLIITQTDRFKAAVAGAALSDLISMYLYVGPALRRPDFFRTENHQFRIGKSLYEDMVAYLKNSPVLLAADIKTPLLGWVGEDDRLVNSLQSMEFYLALRRLNKEHTLLVYPTEQHELEIKKNQIDLSIRIMKWFDYYLKDGKKEPWMDSNFNR